MERGTVPTLSYRDFEAYRLARHLLVDSGPEGEVEAGPETAPDSLSRTALAVAMNLVDGTTCTDKVARRGHLQASLEATALLGQLIAEGRRDGRIDASAAEELLAMQRRAVASLQASLAG